MSTDSGVRDGAVTPEAAADSDGEADAFLPAFPERMYEQAMACLADIINEWHRARDALPRRP